MQGNYVRIAIATLLKSLNAQAAYLVFVSFGGTITLFRPVKGARKSAQIRDKIAKKGQNSAFLCEKWHRFEKKSTPLPRVVVVTNDVMKVGREH